MNAKFKLVTTVLATALYAMGAQAGLKLEAEAYTAEGGGAVAKTSGRPGTSGGVCISGHNDKGHWVEWKFDVAEAGDYQVSMRYAGGRRWTVSREIQINGKSPEGWAKFDLPSTGGFGRSEGEWKNIALPGTVKLEKGSHVIRIMNLGGTDGDGGANLDLIFFGKPGEEITL